MIIFFSLQMKKKFLEVSDIYKIQITLNYYKNHLCIYI